jgi:hypothetical protein
MKTPQIKPEWNTGIYIGNGVIAVEPKQIPAWVAQYYEENGEYPIGWEE